MSLVSFSFDSNAVRTAGTSEHPLFCLKDVCGILGIANHHNKAAKLANNEKETVRVYSGDGVRDTMFVTEPGLYKVVLSCKAAYTAGTTAFKFNNWVVHDVLPKIRKTNEYSLKRKPSDELESIKLKLQG